MNLVQASDQLQTLMGIVRPRRNFDVVGDSSRHLYQSP